MEFLTWLGQYAIANLKMFPIAALGAVLGRIWAARIARNEQHVLSAQLEKLKSSFEIQNTLISQIQQGVQSTRNEIIKHQVEGIKMFWERWIRFRDLVSKFHVPHQILKNAELNNPKYRSRFFPNSSEAEVILKTLDGAVGEIKEIEKLQPLVPVQIFQHYLALSKLYLRIILNWQTGQAEGRIPKWYETKGGEVDWSVDAIARYAASVSLALPDVRATESFVSLSTWKTNLEEKLVSLIYEFFDGSLKSQIHMHRELLDLASEAQTRG
ncbi:MAG: hypothetical protein ACXVCH_15145, partial [Bdellovibrionota bacterium]